jgi:hypothetical protein
VQNHAAVRPAASAFAVALETEGVDLVQPFRGGAAAASRGAEEKKKKSDVPTYLPFLRFFWDFQV